ncbi:hypothetical protein [Pantoea eucrina]|uniref:hypothetical protein n=1 Tax=Pantoea eucrina TaxID=472693 RepID=UPI002FD902D5
MVEHLKKKKKCAYCKKMGTLTKEHIFPSSILKSFKTKMHTINDKTDYSFKGDLVVADVCAECNNGVLSNLDASFLPYFKDQMIEPIKAGSSVTFKYEYDLLLREILKISYNSSRASVSGYEARLALEKYVPYILSGYGDVSGITLSLMIVTSANLLYLGTNKPHKLLEPYLLRSAKIDGLKIDSGKFLVRMVAFNSFWFYLLIPKSPINSKIKNKYWSEFKSKNKIHGVLLKKGVDSVEIKKDKTTYLHFDLIEKMYRPKKK